MRRTAVELFVSLYSFVRNNEVDSEVYWLLQEVFNPWDVNDAVNKQARRLVGAQSPTGAVGAPMVSEAFDSIKDINVSKPGLDIGDSVN